MTVGPGIILMVTGTSQETVSSETAGRETGGTSLLTPATWAGTSGDQDPRTPDPTLAHNKAPQKTGPTSDNFHINSPSISTCLLDTGAQRS